MSAARLQVLAEFRHQLRLFLHFSETAAQKAGLHPQQHQLLLQIAGAPEKEDVTIGYLAERLGLRHNTLVELSDRCEQADLVTRDRLDRTVGVCCWRLRPKDSRCLRRSRSTMRVS